MTRTHTLENPHRVVYLKHTAKGGSEQWVTAGCLKSNETRYSNWQTTVDNAQGQMKRLCQSTAATKKQEDICVFAHMLHCTQYGLCTQRRCFVIGNTVPQDLLATQRDTLEKKFRCKREFTLKQQSYTPCQEISLLNKIQACDVTAM